ncbi:hypothetical protein K439DRAFT_1614546 [Ramaria rubella]|nr:hypothetical protein K439DRAFT_1614546 [Ramaria rubella]
MARGRGYTVQHISLDVGECHLGHSPGIQFIPNSKLPAQRELDNEIWHAQLQYTGNMVGITEELIDEVEPWEDVPMDISQTAQEVQIDLSHEGGEYFHFIDMAQDTFARNCQKTPTFLPSQPTGTGQRLSSSMGCTNAGPARGVHAMNELMPSTQGYDALRALPCDERHAYINQTLVLHGLLGTAPVHPTLAIPISTLTLYRSCRLCCPQFSIQQWVKVLCDISNINYNHLLQDNFSNVFDTYLDIIWREDHTIKVQLGHESPNWQILHACPPCQYKLAGEAELNPLVLGALDGNNSLKRFLRANHDKVKRKGQNPENAAFEGEIESDLTDGNADHPTCTDCWHMAMADTLKGMYNAFAKTGIFLSEDLETCKRVFAGSNAVAQLTRHATPFHWHQFINMYFWQWDSEKYEKLDMLVKIQTLMSGREISEEREYLLLKKSETEADILGVEYVELLDKYHATRTLWENSQKLMADATGMKNQACLRQVSHDMWEGVLFLQTELQAVEESLDVNAQWTLDSPEYQWATEYLCIRTYQHAADKLEGLVVQRLFELTKANVSQTAHSSHTPQATNRELTFQKP